MISTNLLDDEPEFVSSLFLESVFVKVDFGVERNDSIRRQNPIFGDVRVSFNPNGGGASVDVVSGVSGAVRMRTGSGSGSGSAVSRIALESYRSPDRNGRLLMIETRGGGNVGEEDEG